MKHAGEFCNCAPWDYPVPDDFIWPICDFYGSSCFTSYIENGLAEQCSTECLPGCNEVKYTISAEKESIDWKLFCSDDPKARKNRRDVFDIEASNLVRNPSFASSKALSQFQQVLLNFTEAEFNSKYCEDKFRFDIAIVEIIVDSPTVIKYNKHHRVTITDKLANFGNNPISRIAPNKLFTIEHIR